MKFLFVGTSRGSSGAEVHFVVLARALAAAGHTVEAVVRPDRPMAQALAGSGVRLHYGVFRNVLDPRGYRATMAAARQLRPDWLVGGFGKEYWPLVLLGRPLGARVALFRHSTKQLKWLSRQGLPRLAQRFITVSEFARRHSIENGIPAERVQFLYNSVDTDEYRPNPEQGAALRRQLGLAEDAIVLGYVGRIRADKGVFTLFDAACDVMAQEPRLHCLWIGHGPDHDQFRQHVEAHALADRHHMAGWIRDRDLPAYYNAMSIAALPSTIPETFGRVLAEAQACGVPVLGSDYAGMREAVQHEVTGLLLPPDDKNAWRDAIVRLCDPAVRQPMAQAARPFVQEHFSAPVVIECFETLLQEVDHRA